MWHIYIGPRVIIKDHPSIKIERLRLFQNNNKNNLNNQILKHMATHHLPLIVTKIVAS
jgi:hypothetical protein